MARFQFTVEEGVEHIHQAGREKLAVGSCIIDRCLGHSHGQGCRNAMAGNIAENDGETPIVKLDAIVVIAGKVCGRSVEEGDVKLELADGVLTVSGEKKYEKEEKDEHYHSVERSYGSFRRVLSLPEDANADDIDAKFKNGVLTISVPRKEISKSEGGNVKQIEIKSAA